MSTTQGSVRSREGPTPKQAAVNERLRPLLELDLLPFGIFSKIAKETGVTPSYVHLLWYDLKQEG